MKLVVTGANGFIGSHLVPRLSSEGYRVAVVNESDTDAQMDGVQSFTADITVREGLLGVFSDADVVVHLAARNHVLKERSRDPLATYRRVNVEGTRNVVRAAREAGVGTFIHMSSVKVMGEACDGVLDEEAPCMPSTPYGISKLESEEEVRAESSKSGMRSVILRLPMVYGPRNKGNLPRMIRWADRGLPFPLFQPDNLRSMIYVENVVAGMLAVIERAPRGISTYIVKDREDYSTRRIYSAICRELGNSPRFVSIPAAMVRLGGMLFEDFRKITGSFRVSAEKIERDSGFSPPCSMEEGIAKTVAWYRNERHRH